MIRALNTAVSKVTTVGFMVAMSSAATAQQAPPNYCYESAVLNCNYGSWETKGYSSEQECINDNMSNNGCPGENGGGGGGGYPIAPTPTTCASRIPGNC